MSLKIFNNDSLIIDPIIFFEKIHHVFHTGENMTHGPSHLNFWLPYFTEVIENTKLHDIVKTGKTQIGEIQIIKGQQVIAFNIESQTFYTCRVQPFLREIVTNLCSLQAHIVSVSVPEGRRVSIVITWTSNFQAWEFCIGMFRSP